MSYVQASGFFHIVEAISSAAFKSLLDKFYDSDCNLDNFDAINLDE